MPAKKHGSGGASGSRDARRIQRWRRTVRESKAAETQTGGFAVVQFRDNRYHMVEMYQDQDRAVAHRNSLNESLHGTQGYSAVLVAPVRGTYQAGRPVQLWLLRLLEAGHLVQVWRKKEPPAIQEAGGEKRFLLCEDYYP